MGSKKKEKKAEKRAHKAAKRLGVDLGSKEGSSGKRKSKEPKPPKDSAIKRELKRVFGKRLKPDLSISTSSAQFYFDGLTKLGEEQVRRMLMQVLLACPNAVS